MLSGLRQETLDNFNQLLTEEGFYLVRVTDGQHTPVYGVESDGRFIIQDEEGFRKLVTAHVENCDCGEETEYCIPMSVVEHQRAKQKEIVYSADYELLKEHESEILNPYYPQFQKGSYVVYADDIYLDSESNKYDLPPLGSVILVTGITQTETGMYVMEGYTTMDGKIIRVDGEAWRFTQYNPNPED